MADIKSEDIFEKQIYMLTKATPCPYLKDKVEKRIATEITYNRNIHDELAENGFRRVENWMYKPVCENCSACKSYRVLVSNFELSRSLKRINKNLNHINYKIKKNITNQEHFDLFKKYQKARHPSSSMAKMDEDEFTSMIEISPINTSLMEFRNKNNNLVGVILLDINKNSLSAVYSFFEPDYQSLGLGNYMIIQCLIYGKLKKLKYLYLGYYISQLSSMSYKARFKPGQILYDNEWKIL